MVLAVNQCVTPRDIYPSSTAGVGFTSGMIVDLPLLGVVTAIGGAPNIEVDWNNGMVNDGTITPFYQATSLRHVDVAAAGSVTTYMGKMVQLNTASQEFSGTVVSVFALEVNSVNSTVAPVDVAIVRSRTGFYFIALASDLSVIDGQ